MCDRSFQERKKRFSEIVSGIEIDSWKNIVEMDPGWQMRSLLSNTNDSGLFSFGLFSVVMAITSLNDYQVRANNYWDNILLMFENNCNENPTLDSIKNLLIQFYDNERFRTTKIKRLNKFLKSDLAQELTRINSSEQLLNEISITDLWNQIARIMNQNRLKKTIVFSIKMLGMTIMMSGNYDFEFSIPIPVDSRIIDFTNEFLCTSTFCAIKDETTIQRTYDDILENINILREINEKERINMIYLDSFVWQLNQAVSDENHFNEFCEERNLREMHELFDFLQL